MKLLIAKKEEMIEGFSLILRQRKIADVFQCGFNYELQEKSDFTYFNLVFYSPIKWAIEEGIEKMYYRYTTESAKIRRGCKPESNCSFIKCYNSLINSQIGSFINIRNRLRMTRN